MISASCFAVFSASESTETDPNNEQQYPVFPINIIGLNNRAVRDLEVGRHCHLRPALEKLQRAARLLDAWLKEGQRVTTGCETHPCSTATGRSERQQQQQPSYCRRCPSDDSGPGLCCAGSATSSQGGGRDDHLLDTCHFQPSQQGLWSAWERPVRIIRTNAHTTAMSHPRRQMTMTMWAQRMACATVLHNLGLSYLFWHRATMGRSHPADDGAAVDGAAVLLGGAHFVLRRSHEVLVLAQTTPTASGRDTRSTLDALDLSRRILAASNAVLAEFGRREAGAGRGNQPFAGQGPAQPADSNFPEELDGISLIAECDSSVLGVSSSTAAAAA